MAKESYCFKNNNNENKTIDLYSSFSSQYTSSLSKRYEAADYWGSLINYSGGEDSHFRTLDGTKKVIYAIPHRTLNITKNENLSLSVIVSGVGSWTTSQSNIDVAANRTYSWSATANEHYHFYNYNTNTPKSISGSGDFKNNNINIAPVAIIDTYYLYIYNPSSGNTVTLSGGVSGTIVPGTTFSKAFNYGSTPGIIYATSGSYSGSLDVGTMTSNKSYNIRYEDEAIYATKNSSMLYTHGGGSYYYYASDIGATQTMIDNYNDWVVVVAIACSISLYEKDKSTVLVSVTTYGSTQGQYILGYKYFDHWKYNLIFTTA